MRIRVGPWVNPKWLDIDTLEGLLAQRFPAWRFWREREGALQILRMRRSPLCRLQVSVDYDQGYSLRVSPLGGRFGLPHATVGYFCWLLFWAVSAAVFCIRYPSRMLWIAPGGALLILLPWLLLVIVARVLAAWPGFRVWLFLRRKYHKP